MRNVWDWKENGKRERAGEVASRGVGSGDGDKRTTFEANKVMIKKLSKWWTEIVDCNTTHTHTDWFEKTGCEHQMDAHQTFPDRWKVGEDLTVCVALNGKKCETDRLGWAPSSHWRVVNHGYHSAPGHTDAPLVADDEMKKKKISGADANKLKSNWQKKGIFKKECLQHELFPGGLPPKY